eukprot:scaffold150050_cov17-Tisochrysis_lutea.AAC.3
MLAIAKQASDDEPDMRHEPFFAELHSWRDGMGVQSFHVLARITIQKFGYLFLVLAFPGAVSVGAAPRPIIATVIQNFPPPVLQVPHHKSLPVAWKAHTAQEDEGQLLGVGMQPAQLLVTRGTFGPCPAQQWEVLQGCIHSLPSGCCITSAPTSGRPRVDMVCTSPSKLCIQKGACLSSSIPHLAHPELSPLDKVAEARARIEELEADKHMSSDMVTKEALRATEQDG